MKKRYTLSLLYLGLMTSLPPVIAQRYQEAIDEPEAVALSAHEADAIILQQEQEKRVEKAQREARKVRFVVIQRNELPIGENKVIFNRVAPPRQAVLENQVVRKFSPQPNADQMAEMERLALLEQEMFSYSATVFDHKLTRLSWQYDGQTYTAWSNVDFNYLRGVSCLENDGVFYSILMGIGNETLPSPAERSLESDAGYSVIPTLPDFTPGRAEYVVFVQSDETPDEGAFTVIDLLHKYYEENASKLRSEYERREAIQAARERYNSSSPPDSKDIVINFWKNDSTQSEALKGGRHE